MDIVDEETVARILDPAAARRVMRETFIAAAMGGAHGPVRAVLQPHPGAWMAAMPGAVRTPSVEGLGAKIVSAYPENASRGKLTHLATVLLLDPNDGSLLALVAGETITERRTAALSVLATERLAVRPRGRYAILGSGAQARAHRDAFLDAGFIERLHVWSPTRSHAERFVAESRSAGIDATLADSSAAAVRDADVIVTATAAVDPLFDVGDVAQGVHVNAVGSSVPGRAELPPQLVASAAVYVESRDAALRESGDLARAMRERANGERDLIAGELGEMLADPARPIPRRHATIFKSVGVGIADVAAAAYVLAQVRAGL